ncbi:LacI family DNA-binding transcriptional regulator [Aquibacillus sp. 3ASR75-11]|uniref:LacI family DNA-binding transcriptional regulator n=1 Tax=Terrihalobacillus insolitus TaxID=2950438 RepID=A0A9X3WQB1_9BACI|nr:LacI family DNA-binding transcriptional regulator [Terrihalobacillus insolitus]MDC3412037.1 LacI family DNA-binding transcriptional regulator [Terrihalobacillus insolitus]MDC3423270.1 LacI family DNA-binding transcriptional regulator [Terrihalobacillus insolitus]
MANIQDVAKKAGVSVATVSRVLNNHSSVTEKTRIKVEKVISELSYEPSMLGRNLRTSESKLLLVLLPSVSNPYYTEIINGIEETAIRNGYNILLCETDSNPERESRYFSLVKNRMADGIISMDPAVNKERLFELAKTYPIVQCSEYDKGADIPFVTINSELAAYHAVKHLIKLGHKKIALLTSDEQFLYARERRLGYERALREFDIEVNKQRIYYAGNIGFENGQQGMRSLLELDDRPTAVFAVSDILAIGALKEINSNGLRVPNDIAIVGFDKISFSNMTYPTLTTIAQPMYRMGSMSATMLINKIQGKHVESIVMDHELVIREST